MYVGDLGLAGTVIEAAEWSRTVVHSAVAELCPNAMFLAQLEMLDERKQLPRIVENRHSHIYTM